MDVLERARIILEQLPKINETLTAIYDAQKLMNRHQSFIDKGYRGIEWDNEDDVRGVKTIEKHKDITIKDGKMFLRHLEIKHYDHNDYEGRIPMWIQIREKDPNGKYNTFHCGFDIMDDDKFAVNRKPYNTFEEAWAVVDSKQKDYNGELYLCIEEPMNIS